MKMKKLSPKAGLSPGSLVFVGHKKTDKTAIDIMDFNPTELRSSALKIRKISFR
jgi:hypothetical protein